MKAESIAGGVSPVRPMIAFAYWAKATGTSLKSKDLPIFPADDWFEWPIAISGWSDDGLNSLSALLAASGSTALMVIDSGRLAFRWGDVALKSSVASVRKSLINILYGIYVAEGSIDLAATLADMQIDDIQPLTSEERRATVADLLKARSGIYLPAVYERQGRPVRGSHAPGDHWFYNNWDFNVLGTIFERATGRSIFEAFFARVAVPLGMQDFTADDGRYQQGSQSQHPVYKISMSARDLARVGLLYLLGGRWGDYQLVPSSWVQNSTVAHSDIGKGRGYGYLWWTAEANAPGDGLSIDVPLFYASGFGGQYIIVIPGFDLVVVHRVARVDEGISHDRMGEILRLVLAAMPPRKL
jgi:CubicO group peptidase (beta-lactamase class C family)